MSDSEDTHPSTVTAWIKIVLGIVLLGLAAMRWRSRSDTDVPGWMRAIDSLSAVVMGAVVLRKGIGGL